MERLIDAIETRRMELIDRRKLVSDFWKGVEDCAILSYDDTEELMENAPTVDAVEVVRCSSCKHSTLPAVLTQRYGEPGTLTCHNWKSPCNKRNVKAYGFCPYGERRTDG